MRKYPTFQDRYGQMAPQDPTFEQNKAPEMQQEQAPLNPWSGMRQPASMQDPEMGPQQIELAPKPWEYAGK